MVACLRRSKAESRRGAVDSCAALQRPHMWQQPRNPGRLRAQVAASREWYRTVVPPSTDYALDGGGDSRSRMNVRSAMTSRSLGRLTAPLLRMSASIEATDSSCPNTSMTTASRIRSL